MYHYVLIWSHLGWVVSNLGLLKDPALRSCGVNTVISSAPGIQKDSVQFSRSAVFDSLRPCGLQHARPPCPSPAPRAYSTHVHRVGDAIQLSLLSLSPPAFSLSQHQGLFQWVLHVRWWKYWSFSFSISPSNEHPGLISFRMDWLELLAVPGTLKSLLQHHSSKASILQHSAFFILQFSHPYMTTGKTTALTGQTFVGKVISLLFSMLCRLVIAFLLRSKHFLISWQWLLTICSDFGAPQNKVFHHFHCFPIFLP